MHIKQVVIQGFKSYKNQTIIEPFSPKHNVIVGRNGSGKSNFFSAIRFVLSDAYTHLGREERQALLHEGSGSAVMSAYVEIIFDNSDHRFPTGKDEVILRRTIGLKKDEYSLDRKSATKSDVMNLLESGGFSKSNPYYIVPQGRVTSLTTAKDSERLQLLKEVAGTKVYEQRREESVKIMAQTTTKREKIEELLAFIGERLSELEEEKKELKQYQDKDKERRSLEFTLYSRELEEISNMLSEIDESRNQSYQLSDTLRESFISRESRLDELRATLEQQKQELELANIDKSQVEDELNHLIKDYAAVELAVRGVDAENISSEGSQIQEELEQLVIDIQSREALLEQKSAAFQQTSRSLAESRDALDQTESQLRYLKDKSDRSSIFQSKQERDQWLRREVQDIESALTKKMGLRSQVEEEISTLTSQVEQVEAQVEQLRLKIDHRDSDMKKILEETRRSKDRIAELTNGRKQLWREEASLDSILANAKAELQSSTRIMNSSMDRSTSEGLRSCARLAKSMGLEGYYGPLSDLFSVDDRYRTSVEVTAGNSLFHVVVDNDDTAVSLIQAMAREKSGRVTFMPLNRLHPPESNYPDTTDAIPLISKLRYHESVALAMKQVFGKTIICPDIELAAQYAKSHSLSAITLQGDRSDKRGTLSGGYYDTRKSRLVAVHNVKKWRDILERENERETSLKAELEKISQQITEEMSRNQKIEMKRNSLNAEFSSISDELSDKAKDDMSLKASLQRQKQILENLNADISNLERQKTTSQSELRSDFKKSISKADESKRAKLEELLESQKKAFVECERAYITLQSETDIVESELSSNFYLRRDTLKSRLSDLHDLSGQSKEFGSEQMESTRAILARLRSRNGELEQNIENSKAELRRTEEELGSLQQLQIEEADSIEREQRNLEMGINKRNVLLRQREEASRKVRDLGVLPEEAYEKFQRISSENVLKKLHKLKESLKGFSHVNKKAFEQYSNFTKQQEQLLERQAELESSQKSIQELVTVLDQRKDEALERTFKQVSKNFAEIFERLVPAGIGRLIMQKRTDRRQSNRNEEEDDSDAEEEQQRRSRHSVIENYIGVAISVSFNSKYDEQQRIQQLSGGQKSLCALALIFAIQRCDPAPFYLFDEIDANLDAQYRSSLASLLSDMSESGQFICTTFRPEQLQTSADQFYGVFLTGKLSSIQLISKEDALGFVEANAQ